MAKRFVKQQLIYSSNRGAMGEMTKRTDAYEAELRGIVNTWFKQLKGKDAYDIDAEIAVLLLLLQDVARRHYKIAYQTGLNDKNLNAEDLRKIELALASNLAYLRNSYAPALKRKINDLIDRGLPFDDAVVEAQNPMMSRIALYAGSAWVLMQVGKAASMERRFGTTALNDVPVRRLLDAKAEHCGTCPGKAGEYESWNEMLMFCGGLPADGSDECHSNCRCSLQVWDGGGWVYIL